MDANEDQVLTPADVAARLRVTRQTVYGLLNGGEIECVRVGRSIRVQESALRHFIERNTIRAKEAANTDG